jgi:O-antigen ligase
VLTEIQWQRLTLAIALPVTAVWLSVVDARIGGDFCYFIPLVAIGLIAIAVTLGSATARGHAALLGLLVVAVTVLSYRVRPPDSGVEDGRDWQNMIKIGVWGCMLLPCLFNWRPIVRFWRDPGFATFLAFVVLSVASSAWSAVPVLTFASAVGLFVYLIFGSLIAGVISERTAMRTLIGSLAAYCIINWIVAALAPDMGFWDTGESYLRLQGISGHPNLLGAQMAIFLCLLIGAYGRSYISRVAFLVLLGLGIVTLLGTQSRTSILSLVLSVAAVHYRRSFFIGALTCLVILTFVVMTDHLDQLISLFVREGNADALAGRTDIWDYLGQKIAERPLFGYGFNAFEATAELDIPNLNNPMSSTSGQPPSHPHNNFLEVLFSGGIVTMLPFMAWIVLMIKRWLLAPNVLRDLIILFLLFDSFTEVNVAGSPWLVSIVLFILLAFDVRDNVNRDGITEARQWLWSAR